MSCLDQCSVIEETTWLERGNVNEWVLGSTDPVTGDFTPLTDLSGLTRAVLCVGSVQVDSAVDATLIWWTDSVAAKTLPDGSSFTGDVLRARPGLTTGLSVGEYSNCRIVIFDASYTTGLVMTDCVHFTVNGACL